MIRTFALALILIQLTHSTNMNYNETIAAKMSNLSAAAYFSSEILDVPCPRCYPQFQLHNVIQTMGLLAIVGFDPQLDLITVIFRGTINVESALIDLVVVPMPYPRFKCKACTVHTGFMTAYTALYFDGLKVAIVDMMDAHPKANIIFTGHSLGGALANYAALRFHEQYGQDYPHLLCYTFGEPRVGNDKYAIYHSQNVPNHYRVVHKGDIIPHKPSYLLNGVIYRHSGMEVWYKDGMEEQPKVCEGDSIDCSNSLGQLFSNKQNLGIRILEHNFVTYAKLYDRIYSHSPNDDL